MTYEFRDFATSAEEAENLSGDKEKRRVVEEMLKEAGSVDPEGMSICARFIKGDVYPKWDTTNVNVGPSLMYDSISKFSNVSAEEVEDMVVEHGDVGIVSEKLMEERTQTGLGSFSEENNEKNLSVVEVFEEIDKIAGYSGSGSQQKKIDGLSNLLSDSSPVESKFIARLVLNEMRIGIGEGTVRDAIAHAFDIDKETVKMSFMVSNDISKVSRVALEEGSKGLENMSMEVMTPVDHMLANGTSTKSCLDDLPGSRAAFEIKYDGARLQAHKKGEQVKLFSRGFEELSEALPEVVESVKENVQAEEAIIDGEVVAYYTDEEKPAPYKAVTERLKRKYDIEEKQEEIEMRLQAFDILYSEGEEHIQKPLEERKEELSDIVDDSMTVSYWEIDNEEGIMDKMAKARQDGNEGLMAKSLEAEYRPGNRGSRWLKLKPEGETIDVVITGAEWGEGRREGVFGAYELSVLDENGNLHDIGRMGTGLTDKELEEFTEILEEYVISENGKEVDIKPEIVIEVRCEDIQESPTYSSGYALRFPRLEKEEDDEGIEACIRDDKGVEDANTISRVEDIKKEL